jgi:TetR/AcrR family transcriptional regulator, cholesterol catabolism regulator
MVGELLLPVMQRQVGHYRAIVGLEQGAADALRLLIYTAVAEAAETPSQTRMIRNDAGTFSSMPALRPVANLLIEAAKLWASVVDRGVAAGEFRTNVDTRLVVAAMFDAALSTTRWFAGKQRRSPDRVGAALADLFLGGLLV